MIFQLFFIHYISFIKNFNDIKSININKTILHLACESGNVELVKYIISLNKIDVTLKTISFMFYSIQSS